MNKHLVEGYGRWLSVEDYAYATEYLELTTIKQAVNWLIAEKYLPSYFQKLWTATTG